MSFLTPTLRLVLLPATAALSMATLEAQGCAYLPDNNPATGPGSITPFGDTNPLDPPTGNQAILFKIPSSLLPPTRARICALGFASVNDRVHELGVLSIRLGQSTTAGLVPIFSQNMPGFTQEVFGQGNWRWTTPANQWQYVGLSSNFPYNPANGDLVVMITVGGGASTGTGSAGFHSDPTTPSVLQTAWRFAPGVGVVGTGAPKIKVCWDAKDLQAFGGGCAGSHGRVPQMDLSGNPGLGGSINIALRDAAPTSPGAVLFLDARIRATPVDLVIFGAPGCRLDTFFTSMTLIPVQGGAVTVPAGIPNAQSLLCAVLWAQWAPIDLPANTLGITTSTVGRILIGN